MISDDQAKAVKAALGSAIDDMKMCLVRNNGIPQSGDERESFVTISAKALVLAAALKVYKC